MTRSLFPFLAVVAGCNSKQVIEDAQCSDEEQGMFMACLSSGCSASYAQDLSGADSCSVEGGGTVVSVEAGGECGFTSSGSCYVLCDCPDGVGVEFNTADREPQESPSEYEGDMAGECSDRADNDRDGLYDCNDPDCEGSPDCAESVDTADSSEEPGTEDTGAPEDTGETGGEDPAVDADGDGYTVGDGDCNDRNPAINPSSTDIVGDLIDQNCDGIDGTDMDRDGFASEASGGSDCDDFDAVINPNYGIWDETDYVDSNCDGEDGLNWTYKSLTLSHLYIRNTGDFDGDSKTDLVLYETRTGDVCIIFGSSLSSSAVSVMTASDCDILTDIGGQEFSVGDVDSDGKDDLLHKNYSTGTGYLFYGSTIATSTALWSGSNHDIVISPGWGSITYFQIIEDVNGDSVDDIFVYASSYVHILVSPFTRSSLTVSTDKLVSLTGTYAYDGITVLPLDLNYNGKMDFLFDRGYADVSTSKRNFSTFFPTGVLPDIDGDGNKEITDGNCVQNASNYSDSSFCDYYVSYTLTARQLADFDGDGLADDYFYCSVIHSTYYDCYIKKDILLAPGSNVHIHGAHANENYFFSGDFNGDGKDEIVASDGSSSNIIGFR
jgi:hypothetical protein